MGEGFVKTDAHRHPVRVSRRGGAKKLFILRRAAAEQNDLNIALHQHVENALHQIESLLRCEARDHADNRRITLIWKAEHASELFLAGALSREAVFAVVMGEIRIHPGIPLVVIDAVQNAHEIRGALTHDTLEAEALLGAHDFLGVGRAHRGDLVGEEERALKKIDVTIKLQVLRAEIAAIKVQ